jgi:hypothetical protein
MQQSTSFDIDSIQLVIKTMGGEGNVTIIRVKGGHGREENNYFEAEASEGGEVTSSEQFVYSQQHGCWF